MKTYKIILTPKASITSFPSSDTLFGAICWGIRTIYGENGNSGLNKILNEFSDRKDGTPFILSSSFPLLKNKDSQIFFYPKPIRKDLIIGEVEEIYKNYEEKFEGLKKSKVKIISELKKFKKASLVSENIFNEIINGTEEKLLFEKYLDEKIFEVEENKFIPEYFGGKIKLVGKMLMTNEEYREIFTDGKRPKVLKDVSIQKNLLDRISLSTTGEGQTFYSDEYFLGLKVKLYFLIKTNGIDYLKPVFKYLEDTGIGKDRFTGKGNFKFSNPEEFSLPDDKNEKTFVTLSKYIPNINEILVDKEKMFYELLPYCSKVESIFEFKGEDVFKDKVIYIKEGSVFEAKEKKEFYGLIPEVKQIEDKKILQNGLAFPVFGKVGE